MYLPEGNVMPAYSTWQPTEGKIPPTASADQSATRRFVDPRGDLIWGNPIVSTLLGVLGGPFDTSHVGGKTAVGESSPVPPPEPAELLSLSWADLIPHRQIPLSGPGCPPFNLAARSSGSLLG